MWKGLSSKIFGGDNPEAREAKLQTLETQIEESENAVTDAQQELRFLSFLKITSFCQVDSSAVDKRNMLLAKPNIAICLLKRRLIGNSPR